MGITVVGNTNPAKLEAQFDNWTYIHVQVRDASTIFLSRDRVGLETPGPNGLQGGLTIAAADGIKTLRWIGKLFIKGSNPQSIYDVEAFDDIPEQVNVSTPRPRGAVCAA
jgi:hypothetical protein